MRLSNMHAWHCLTLRGSANRSLVSLVCLAASHMLRQGRSPALCLLPHLLLLFQLPFMFMQCFTLAAHWDLIQTLLILLTGQVELSTYISSEV